MATYTVERTATVDTPVERVYPLIAEFSQWTRWSPWEDLDPDLHRSYSGPASGTGSVYAWSGNRRAGAGRMEIVSAEENRQVDIDLDFEKPFRSHARTTFELRPVGDRTQVTWRMTGEKPLLMRITGPLLSMDRFVGKDMDKGLARMALVAPPG